MSEQKFAQFFQDYPSLKAMLSFLKVLQVRLRFTLYVIRIKVMMINLNTGQVY